MKLNSRLLVFVFVAFLCMTFQTKAQSWSPVGNGLGYGSDYIGSLTVYEKKLYAAAGPNGSFAGNPAQGTLANWNGTSWSVDPHNLGVVKTMYSDSSGIYLGGLFGSNPQPYELAKRDSLNWTQPLFGQNGSFGLSFGSGTVYAITQFQGKLYAGGDFLYAGPYSPFQGNVSGIACWDGTGWKPLAAGLGDDISNGTTVENAIVRCMLVYNNELYLGGSFTITTPGSSKFYNIAKWDGSNLYPIGSGAGILGNVNNQGYGSEPGTVNALAEMNGSLYAAGTFMAAGGVRLNNIAKWDGTRWDSLGGGITIGPYNVYTGAPGPAIIYSLASYHNSLYAGGDFEYAGGAYAVTLAQWDGTSWTAVGDSFRGTGVSAMQVFQDSLYVAGGINSIHGVWYNNIARWTAPYIHLVQTKTNPGCYNSCNGSASVSARTGTGSYTYSWSPSGGNGPTASNLCAGNYTVFVTDSIGQMASSVFQLINPAKLSVSGLTSYSKCKSNTVTLSPTYSGGCTNYTYSWFPAGSLNSGTVAQPVSSALANTSYTVWLTDCNGCRDSSQMNVTYVPDSLALSFSGMIPSGCNQSNGQITAAAAAGSGAYSYSWNTIPVQLTAIASGVLSGTYSLTVSDSLGCTVSSQVTIADSCNFVWPGDANNDGIADMNDILSIGIGNGKTGSTRAGATLNWVPASSAPWADTLATGTNFNHIDCNGDGIINPTDTVAVLQNYSLTHAPAGQVQPLYNPNFSDLFLQTANDTLVSGNSGSMQIVLGRPAKGVYLYGLSFNISFDPTLVIPSSVGLTINGSWMGTKGTNLLGVAHLPAGSGTESIAITRTNQINAGGNGQIGTLYFQTNPSLLGTGQIKKTYFTLTAVNAILYNQTKISLNALTDSIYIKDSTMMSGIGSAVRNAFEINVAPNPFDESTTIYTNGTHAVLDFDLFDLQGRELRHFQSAENAVALQKGTLKPGMYLLKLSSGGQSKGQYRLIIQ